MRCLLLLLTSTILITSLSHASDKTLLSQSEQLTQGLSAMRTGDKSKAWEMMFPLAQAGDVQSMFYLGEMMLRSPEYGDNLDRAIKFFTVAAAKGHKGAQEMLPRVRSMIEQKTSGAIPNIAGMNGVLSKAELDKANAKLAQYKAEVLRYTDNIVENIDVPRIDVMVFIGNTDANTERLYSMTQRLENQFGTKIKTRFFVVINPAEWEPSSPPIGGTNLPPKGFTPDFKGQLAAQHGVVTLPSVVVLPPNGKARVVNDLSSLSTLISSLL